MFVDLLRNSSGILHLLFTINQSINRHIHQISPSQHCLSHMALLADSVISDGIAHHPLSTTHTLFRFTFPYGGVRTTSAIAIDTSALSIENQARQIFAHVTSHLSKQHILNLLRETPSKWKQRSHSAVNSDAQPFILSPELYSLLSPFLKHTLTQQVVNYNGLIQLLRQGLPNTPSPQAANREINFDILPDPFLPNSNEQSNRLAPLPSSAHPPASNGSLARTTVTYFPPTMEVSQIMSAYNTASKQILSQQKMEPKSAIDCGHANVVLSQPETLLHRLHGLQLAAQEKNMAWSTYKDRLENILESGIPGDASKTLKKEFEIVYPKIYSGVNIDLSLEEDPHAHLHSHLHTLHVIPVLRGLMTSGAPILSSEAPTQAVQDVSLQTPPIITTATKHEVKEAPPTVMNDKGTISKKFVSFSSLRILADFIERAIVDATVAVKAFPLMYCLNASRYLEVLSKLDPALLEWSCASPQEFEEIAAPTCPLQFGRLLKDLTSEVCALLKNKVIIKELKTARKIIKLIYHNPEKAQFKDLLKAMQLIHDYYSQEPREYIDFVRCVIQSIANEGLLPGLAFLVSRMAHLVGDNDNVPERQETRQLQCNYCQASPSSVFLELKDGRTICLECFERGDVDDCEVTAVTQVVTVSTQTQTTQIPTVAASEEAQAPEPHRDTQRDSASSSAKEASTSIDAALVGRNIVDWRDFFEGVLNVPPDDFKLTLAAVACLRHSQIVHKLSNLSSRNLEQIPLKAQSSRAEKDDFVTAINDLILAFAKELCFLLKDPRKEWIDPSPEDGELFTQARQLAKLMYHRLDERNCAELLKIFSLLSSAFLTSRRQNHPWVKTFLWRLISTVLEKPTLCDALRTLMCSIRDGADPPPSEAGDKESASVLVSSTCSTCQKKMDKVAISTGTGAVLCCTCWWNSEKDFEGTPLLVTTPTLSKVVPSIATSHLLAHQQNMLENVIGTRKAVLPDDRHAVMSTSVHEYSLVHRAGTRDSSALIKETMVSGGTGHNLEEVTTIHELVNRRPAASATKEASMKKSTSLLQPSASLSKDSQTNQKLTAPSLHLKPSDPIKPSDDPSISPSPLATPDLEQSIETESAGPLSPRQVFSQKVVATSAQKKSSLKISQESANEQSGWTKVESLQPSAVEDSKTPEAVTRPLSITKKVTQDATTESMRSEGAVSPPTKRLSSRQIETTVIISQSSAQECQKPEVTYTKHSSSNSKPTDGKPDESRTDSPTGAQPPIESNSQAEEADTATLSSGEESAETSRSQSSVKANDEARHASTAAPSQGPNNAANEVNLEEEEETEESELCSDSELSGTFECEEEESEDELLEELATEKNVKDEKGTQEILPSASEGFESELCTSDSLTVVLTSQQGPAYNSESTSITDDSGPTDRVAAQKPTGLAPRGQLVSFKIGDSFSLESDPSLRSTSGEHILSGHTNSIPLEVSQELDSDSESHTSTTLSSRGPSPPSSVTMGSPDRPLFPTQSLTAFRSESNTAESLLLNSDLLPAEPLDLETPSYTNPAFDRHISLTASEVDVFKSVRKLNRDDSKPNSALPSVNERAKRSPGRQSPNRQDSGPSRFSPRQVKRWPTTTANAAPRNSFGNSNSSLYDQGSTRKNTPRQDMGSAGGSYYTSPRFAQPLQRQVSPWERSNANRNVRSQGTRGSRGTATSNFNKPQSEVSVADRLMMGESVRSSRRGKRVERWR